MPLTLNEKLDGREWNAGGNASAKMLHVLAGTAKERVGVPPCHGCAGLRPHGPSADAPHRCQGRRREAPPPRGGRAFFCHKCLDRPGAARYGTSLRTAGGSAELACRSRRA